MNGSIEYIYHQPEQIDNYLQTASIFQSINNSTAFYSLMEKIIKQKFGRLESLLILKDQKLVLEEYFYGYDQTQLHDIHSCTKSITSLLLGISLDRHKKLNVDQPVFNFFPRYDSLRTPEKGEIKLKHVLTMTAGFQEEKGFEGTKPDDKTKNILSLPLGSTPGEKFKYSGNVQIFSAESYMTSKENRLMNMQKKFCSTSWAFQNFIGKEKMVFYLVTLAFICIREIWLKSVCWFLITAIGMANKSCPKNG